MMLQTKYECSQPYGLSQEDFKYFFSIFSHFVAMATRVFDGINFLTIFVDLHPRNIPVNFYQDWSSGFGGEDF